MDFLYRLTVGLVELPWWGYVLVALGLTHVTIAAVTIYLHRHQAHRALDLHPVVSHFFRFWLWLTTGMVTKEWAAVHRKHHAKCETADDPHSPQIYGLRKVLLEGTELYRLGAGDPETLARYGHGTPNDWIERNLYTRYSMLGVATMMALNIVLFGALGLSIWGIQMLWIPVFAAGVINGLGHHSGYRNFQTDDASTNIVPWGVLIGGEELHNNHHAYASSARLSSKWYEFDIGWLYIRLMELVGLAQVKKLAPKIRFEMGKARCDLQTLQAVITHRYDVVQRFARTVRITLADELERLKARGQAVDMRALKRWIQGDGRNLQAQDRARLEEALNTSKVLATIYSMRQELGSVWARSTASKEQLVHQLEDWCRRAEKSGIAQLEAFSRTLRGYAMA
ncbi:MAG TPA: fatty acid desaturase [Burkholderiales bacterium]|nr:fatty acid desaturase [Burkholderiales bacterium]